MKAVIYARYSCDNQREEEALRDSCASVRPLLKRTTSRF